MARGFLLLALLGFALHTSGQINTDTIEVVAIAVGEPVGSKVKIQRFAVLLSITGNVYLDTF